MTLALMVTVVPPIHLSLLCNFWSQAKGGTAWHKDQDMKGSPDAEPVVLQALAHQLTKKCVQTI